LHAVACEDVWSLNTILGAKSITLQSSNSFNESIYLFFLSCYLQCLSIVKIDETRPAYPHPTSLHHSTLLCRSRLALHLPRPLEWEPCNISASWPQDSTLLCRPASGNPPSLRYCKVIERPGLSRPPETLFLIPCTGHQYWLGRKLRRGSVLVVRIMFAKKLRQRELFSYCRT
jgi:hypothetical protein